ncbi:hypothetical protein Tco_1068393 [Tanacetum coccineum]|uniref:Uncharacterized protein n=1 Tax=Tanacetum coccineum TaxID=301880 RepID=A0ABQ5HFS5_9ASTR
MLNSLMYKLSYFRFVETDGGKGYDRVRRTEIGKKHFKLTHFEEVFTTHHWMVRIYKLKPQKNRIRVKTKKTKSVQYALKNNLVHTEKWNNEEESMALELSFSFYKMDN